MHGQNRLDAITIVDDARHVKETVRTHTLVIFIGGTPHPNYLQGVVECDRKGFILTGSDLTPRQPGWTLDRAPLQLETSMPGVFSAGDVRCGSVKRVAAAVGEGAAAVQFIHSYLDSTASPRPRASMDLCGVAR